MKIINRRLPLRLIAALLMGPTLCSTSVANIDLEWQPENQTVVIGTTFDLALYAVSDDPEASQSISAMDVIMEWAPAFLSLVGNTDNGPYEWSFSGFQDDSGLDGLNDTWFDGDALYTAHAQLGGDPAWAPPDGLLVTTFQFTALAETPTTVLSIPETAGEFTETAVYDGYTPGLDVHGSLGSATITIVPEPQTLTLALFGALMIRRTRRHRR